MNGYYVHDLLFCIAVVIVVVVIVIVVQFESFIKCACKYFLIKVVGRG